MSIARHEVVQQLLDLHEIPRYLEIGVDHGVTFHAVSAPHKVAVDPEFRFDVQQAQAVNPAAAYHPVTSDDYFGTIARPDDRFDVIYLDGLHTAEQTLRDFVNSISFLGDGGVIVIDDVRPPTHLASLPDRRVFHKVREYLHSGSKTWMGDVYRIVYFIETFAQQFSYRIIQDNHGQAVVWRKVRQSVPDRTISAVGSKRFEDMVLDEQVFPLLPFVDIIKLIRNDLP